jgi:hypothetical protein
VSRSRPVPSGSPRNREFSRCASSVDQFDTTPDLEPLGGGDLDSLGRPIEGSTTITWFSVPHPPTAQPGPMAAPRGRGDGRQRAIRLGLLVCLLILAWWLVVGPWIDQVDAVQANLPV